MSTPPQHTRQDIRAALERGDRVYCRRGRVTRAWPGEEALAVDVGRVALREDDLGTIKIEGVERG